MEYTFVSAILIIFIYLMFKVNKLEQNIKQLKYSLEQFTKGAEDSEHPINNRLYELIQDGKEIKAIKEARIALGLSLIEGKEYVEMLKNQMNR
ncbi:hypothetical protein NSQ77_12255 [Oceanobacillus sp. FSL K6-2867]|uniref:hypothetical protein n=1 Tax=Oceanobacillus sp. FSL K6-2867 TaxID=2954748 RepID=UPI0030DBC10D